MKGEIKMLIKNAYYAKSLPRHSVIETVDGKFYAFRDVPFRMLTEADLTPLVSNWGQMAIKDEIPDYTLKFYGLVRAKRDTEEAST
jgi:hypothetical protein